MLRINLGVALLINPKLLIFWALASDKSNGSERHLRTKEQEAWFLKREEVKANNRPRRLKWRPLELILEKYPNSLRQIFVSLRLKRELNQQLNQYLAKLKDPKNRLRTYSKKSWILEAIEEKLESEEDA